MQERRRGKERRNDKEEKQLLRPEPSHLAVILSRAVMLDIKTHDYHSQLNRDVIKDARRGLE